MVKWQEGLPLLQSYKEIKGKKCRSQFIFTITEFEIIQSCQGHGLKSRLMLPCLENKLGYWHILDTHTHTHTYTSLITMKSCQHHRTKDMPPRNNPNTIAPLSLRSRAATFCYSALGFEKETMPGKHTFHHKAMRLVGQWCPDLSCQSLLFRIWYFWVSFYNLCWTHVLMCVPLTGEVRGQLQMPLPMWHLPVFEAGSRTGLELIR